MTSHIQPGKMFAPSMYDARVAATFHSSYLRTESMHMGENHSPAIAYPRLFPHHSIPYSVLQHPPSIVGKMTEYGLLEHLTYREFPVSTYINLTRIFPMAWCLASTQKLHPRPRFCAFDDEYHVFFIQQLWCANYCLKKIMTPYEHSIQIVVQKVGSRYWYVSWQGSSGVAVDPCGSAVFKSIHNRAHTATMTARYFRQR